MAPRMTRWHERGSGRKRCRRRGSCRHGRRRICFLFDALTGQQLLDLTPTSATPYARAGHSVALEPPLVAVGAPGDQLADNDRVFVFDSNTGVQLFELAPTSLGLGEDFGFSVAIRGGLIFVGSPGDTAGGGSVFVFDGTTGQPIHELKPTPSSIGNLFGMHVAVDGTRVAVNAPFSKTSGWATGSVFVFDIASGQRITELVQNSPPYVDLGSQNWWGTNGFGVGMDYDGGRVVVGAPTDNKHTAWAGSVFLFDDSALNTGQGSCHPSASGQPCPCGGGFIGTGCPHSTLSHGFYGPCCTERGTLKSGMTHSF